MLRFSNPESVWVTVNAAGDVQVRVSGEVVLQVDAAETVLFDDPARGLDVVRDNHPEGGKYIMVDGVQVYKSYKDYACS